jgi:hypothetical protein
MVTVTLHMVVNVVCPSALRLGEVPAAQYDRSSEVMMKAS